MISHVVPRVVKPENSQDDYGNRRAGQIFAAVAIFNRFSRT